MGAKPDGVGVVTGANPLEADGTLYMHEAERARTGGYAVGCAVLVSYGD